VRPEVIKREFSQFKAEVATVFALLHELAVEAGAPADKQVAAGLLSGINAPFLFVVVGEVKSGKSSFINALLRENICAVAPDPCTDRIQKIVYASENYERPVSDQVAELGRPAEILKEIAIVDTPGTNSIIERHQEITEGFIPESDLVIFVFPAQNPYSHTAWELFALVHETWRKKVIFVLQQADRASPEELSVGAARVVEYARARGLASPTVFTVSAKRSWDDAEGSGMAAIWRYIRETVTGGRHYLLKMESLLATAGKVAADLGAALSREAVLLEADRAEAERIERLMARGRGASEREVEVVRARLLAAYDACVAETVAEFEAGLSVGNLVRTSVAGFFRRRNALKDWLAGVNARFSEAFLRRAEGLSKEAAATLSEGVALTMERLLDELKRGRDQAPSGLQPPALTRQRFAVIDQVVANLGALLAGEALADKMRPQGLEKMGDQAVIGGFITAVGAVIAAATHTVVFDVTGGVLTTIGALVALNTLALKRRSVVRRFREGFAAGRAQLETDLGGKLMAQVRLVYADAEMAFAPYFESLESRAERLARLGAKSGDLNRALDGQRAKVAALAESPSDPTAQTGS